jgi:hypothetical protein
MRFSGMVGAHRTGIMLSVLLGATILLLGFNARFAVSACSTISSPWWHVNVGARPTSLQPGHEGTVVVSATNLGDGEVNGDEEHGGAPVVVTDTLPEGVEAIEAFYLAGQSGTSGEGKCAVLLASEVMCKFDGVLGPYIRLEVDIYVNVKEGLPTGELLDGVGITGGGVPEVSLSHPVAVGAGRTPFGVEAFEAVPENTGGSPDIQAGSHPFQYTTTLVLDAGRETKGREFHEFGSFGEVEQPALPKDLRFAQPPGLVGDPSPFPQCTEGAFEHKQCPLGAQLGVAVVTIDNPLPGTETLPVFNMVPATGEPARFGFYDHGNPVFIDTSVRTGRDYGITASANNITQTASFLSAQVTLWGWPGDPSHNDSRGYGCVGVGPLEIGCDSPEDTVKAPFLSLPTSCGSSSSEPFEASVEGDSWPAPEPGEISEPIQDWKTFFQEPLRYELRDASGDPLALEGCNKLSFEPSIKVTPDGTAGSTPTGVTVDVHVPQEEVLVPNGDAESDVKNITVAFPEGVSVDTAGADGLESCSEAQIGYLPPPVSAPPAELHFTSTLAEPFCPNGSKIATAKIKTPLLPNPLEGAVYLAAQEANPFRSLLAVYIVAEDPVSGVLIKLAGKVGLCEIPGQFIGGISCRAVGQIISTFENSPQLPFEDAEFHFFGGERAPLTTPAYCGTYESEASFTPWSGNEPVPSSSIFDINSGPNKGSCPGASLPFNPSLTAGTTSNQAGGFSPFTMTMSREDGNQPLRGVKLAMPPGLLGTLSSVTPCAEAQANAGTCGPESLIGETTVSVGVGGQPYTVTGGKVYITGPYHGAPYGLSIVNPAKAGPFDLEHTATHSPPCDCLIVRAKIEVNPVTAALTVTANSGSEEDAIPTILEGIPLQIKHVNVTINRGGFIFNPTDCNKLAIAASLTSAEGASASLEVPLQVTNCAALAFKPTFAASTKAHNSRTAGASLTTTVTYPSTPEGTEANLAKVKVSLPAKLPARLTTLQKACPEKTFAENPANCPAPARVGEATTKTPVLPNPLSGPAFFVSHGEAKYPELVIVLQGDNVTIDLHGETAISKKGVLTSTFNTVPDAPFSSFELTLPEGPYSALTANGVNLCKAGSLTMPTELTAQDGDVITQSTKVKISGCPKTTLKHKKSKKKPKGKKHKKK